MRKDPAVIKTLGKMTQKSITIRPDKDNQVFTYKQIMDYTNRQINKLSKASKVIVRAQNILRDTTLKSYDLKEMMPQDEYDEYIDGKVADASKFKVFYNFTITIIE